MLVGYADGDELISRSQLGCTVWYLIIAFPAAWMSRASRFAVAAFLPLAPNLSADLLLSAVAGAP